MSPNILLVIASSLIVLDMLLTLYTYKSTNKQIDNINKKIIYYDKFDIEVKKLAIEFSDLKSRNKKDITKLNRTIKLLKK